jgi:hypothetical protein
LILCDSRLSQELTDYLSLLFLFDTSEEFRAEPVDCFWPIEWHFVVDLTALKMAGLASGLKDRLNLAFKIRLPGGAGKGRTREGLPGRPQAIDLGAMTRSNTNDQQQSRQ